MIAFNASSSTTTSAPTTAAAQAGLSFGRRTLGMGLAATVLAAGAYAYTAANTVAVSRAGDGAAEISGYDITQVQYTLDATDPSAIDAVSFTTDAAATTVKAKVVSTATAYQDCTNSSGDGTSWSCDFTSNPAVGAADELTVIATS
jgi:hypothetical protein